MTETARRDNDSTGDYAAVGPSPPRPRVRYELGGVTHPGLARENNEDQFLMARLARSIEVEATSLGGGLTGRPLRDEGLLIVVADGMGGVEGGERASALAVETIESYLRRGFRSFLHLERPDEAAVLLELEEGLTRADRVVLKEAASDPKLEGMGTTLTMAYGMGDTVFILHAGDSRAYHARGEQLTRVTTDHTLVQLLIESGAITAEDARSHPQRNVVTNVIGGPDEGVEADVHKLGVADGDVLLLCSDGLTEPVDDATIAAILDRHPDPRAAAAELVDEALRRGGPDNITVVVARVHVEP
jgi:serine/threonine protein phosphatase PrpC